MHNFFVDESKRQGEFFVITDGDFNHIKNVLRMKIGDEFLVSCEGSSHLCALKAFEGESAVAEIVEENYQDTALPVKLYLFQGLPKAEKMELATMAISSTTTASTGVCRINLIAFIPYYNDSSSRLLSPTIFFYFPTAICLDCV